MEKPTKQEALNQIEELKAYIESLDKQDWIKIGYDQIPKEIFDKYGCRPFKIMRQKMRNDKGEVWNNINWKDAKAEAKKMGYRLPSIQEMLVLLDAYKKKYPNNADVRHKEFLGIEELSYDEEVCYEWVDAPSPCIRGAGWFYGTDAGAFTLFLSWDTGDTNNYVGFRCTR